MVAALVLCHARLFAQQPAPKVDYVPLERPIPFVVVANGNTTNLMAIAAECLKTNGFQLTKLDSKSCAFQAHKPLAKDLPKGQDRLLLWMERDVSDPASIRIFMLFGRYIEVFGKKEMGRIVASASEEEEMTGSWRGGLLERLSKGGN